VVPDNVKNPKLERHKHWELSERTIQLKIDRTAAFAAYNGTCREEGETRSKSTCSVLFFISTKSSVLFLMGTKSSVLLVLCTLAVELRVGGRILLVTVGYPQALRRDSTVPYHAHRTIPRMSYLQANACLHEAELLSIQ
jgi:hypothetical protein